MCSYSNPRFGLKRPATSHGALVFNSTHQFLIDTADPIHDYNFFTLLLYSSLLALALKDQELPRMLLHCVLPGLLRPGIRVKL